MSQFGNPLTEEELLRRYQESVKGGYSPTSEEAIRMADRILEQRELLSLLRQNLQLPEDATKEQLVGRLGEVTRFVNDTTADARRYRHLCQHLLNKLPYCGTVTLVSCYRTKNAVDQALDQEITGRQEKQGVGPSETANEPANIVPFEGGRG